MGNRVCDRVRLPCWIVRSLFAWGWQIMLCGKRVSRSPLLWSAVCMAFSGMLSAGHPPAANTSLAPGCAMGECRTGPVRVPAIRGALLQAAALSVVAGPGFSEPRAGSLKALPRRSRARLPSWYRRAQAAQLRDQTRPAERVGSTSGRSAAPVRVREPVPAAPGSHSREPLRLARASLSTSATSEPPAARRSSHAPRHAPRATRRRRLIEESLEQSFTAQAPQAAHERSPRALPAHQQLGQSSPSPTPLGSDNFTQTIRSNLKGHYALAEPVVINSTLGLPLGDDRTPFEGRLVGTDSNSLRLDLKKDGGDLALFGGLKGAHVDLVGA